MPLAYVCVLDRERGSGIRPSRRAIRSSPTSSNHASIIEAAGWRRQSARANSTATWTIYERSARSRGDAVHHHRRCVLRWKFVFAKLSSRFGRACPLRRRDDRLCDSHGTGVMARPAAVRSNTRAPKARSISAGTLASARRCGGGSIGGSRRSSNTLIQRSRTQAVLPTRCRRPSRPARSGDRTTRDAAQWSMRSARNALFPRTC